MSSMPPPPPPPYGTPSYGTPSYGTPSYGTPSYGTPRASFGVRLLAQFLDGLLYGMLTALFAVLGVVFIISGARNCIDKIDANGNATCTNDELNGPLILLGIVVIALGVMAVLFLYVRALGRTGQTWGRKVANVKVVDQHSMQPIGFGRALGRTLFAHFISSAICYLGYLWMLWDADKQTWHDKVVGTAVINA